MSGVIANRLPANQVHVKQQMVGVALITPLVAVIALGILLPLAFLVSDSIRVDGALSFDNYVRAFSEEQFRDVFFRTAKIAAYVTLWSMLIGYPLAWAMARATGWKVAVLGGIVVLPLWTSVLVRSYAWTFILQSKGLVNKTLMGLGIIEQPLDLMYSETAVIIAMVHVLLPFFILPLYTSLRAIPSHLLRAGESLGATRSTIFMRIVLPLSLPGLGAGAFLVFVMALGFFVTPALLGGGKVLVNATLISQQLQQLGDVGIASALSVILLVITLAATGIAAWVAALAKGKKS